MGRAVQSYFLTPPHLVHVLHPSNPPLFCLVKLTLASLLICHLNIVDAVYGISRFNASETTQACSAQLSSIALAYWASWMCHVWYYRLTLCLDTILAFAFPTRFLVFNFLSRRKAFWAIRHCWEEPWTLENLNSSRWRVFCVTQNSGELLLFRLHRTSRGQEAFHLYKWLMIVNLNGRVLL